MGKEKVVEEVIKNTVNANSSITDMILKYVPLIIGLIAIVACYLLYKKFQSINSASSSVDKLEKQFTGFIKEQSEVNTINSKKFNSIFSQMNQISYIIQNINSREQNDINSQMSPEKAMLPPLEKQPQQQMPQQPPQRELIPNNIQTNFPMKAEQLPDEMLKPVVTTNKKETFNDQMQQQIEQIPTQVMKENKNVKNKNSKKVVTLTEDVLIEEASSDDDE